MSDNERRIALDYALAQSRNSFDAVLDDDDIREAIGNTLAWADIAFDKLVVARDIPPVYAAGLIIGALNSRLLTRLVEPPPDSPSELE